MIATSAASKFPLSSSAPSRGLRVRDGETTIIGGLLQGRDAESIKGVLGLQSLPLINKLVTSHQPSKDETEILISLTPRLVRGPQVTVEDTQVFQAGTEEVIRVRGANALLAERRGRTLTVANSDSRPDSCTSCHARTDAHSAPCSSHRRREGARGRGTSGRRSCSAG